MQIGAVEARLLELGSFEERPLEVGVVEDGPLEVGSVENCLLQVGVEEARILEVGVFEARLPEIGTFQIKASAEPGQMLAAAEHGQRRLDIRCPHLQLGYLLDRGLGAVLAGKLWRPWCMAPHERGQHLGNGGPVVGRVVSDALQA